MKPSLQLKIGQHLTMTPQLQQAIRLLQLSTMDLQIEVQTALETNPMLELPDVTPDTVEEETNNSSEEAREEEEPLLPWEDRLATPVRSSQGASLHPVETFNSPPTTLQDHLLWQMHLTPFSDMDHLIATALIEALDENGFLTCPLEEIVETIHQQLASEIKPPEETVPDNTSVAAMDVRDVEVVLHRIQQFEPYGIGARDLSECLQLQLKQLPHLPWRDKALELVTHHLELLAKRDYPALRRRLGLSLEELREVIQSIHSLNPRPGAAMGKETPEYVIPDIFTFKKEGVWQVELNPDCMPNLQINAQYAQLIRRADESADNQFLRHQLQEAKWFLKSIETRNETLLKVTRCIVEQQKGFLDHGEEAMKPLTLSAVAEMTEMHESTISRITTQKYLHTPRGIFELKYFFSSRLDKEEGGECSATAIRALIKKLIANENRKKPFSDSKLVKLLEHQGFKVARRTITKYREALAIPPSNERKVI